MEPAGQLRLGLQDPLPSARSVLRGQTLGKDRTPDRSDPGLGLTSSDPVISCQNGQCQSLVWEGRDILQLPWLQTSDWQALVSANR